MAVIAVTTAGRVEVIESISQKTQPAAVAIAAGQVISSGTNGTWLLGDAVTNTTGFHIATRSAQIGEPLTGLRAGKMDGWTFTNTIGTALQSSATPGGLDNATSAGSVVLGRVMAASATPLGTAPDKVLEVACPV